MNIFHKLAEKAFEGRYLRHTDNVVGTDLRPNHPDELYFYLELVEDYHDFMSLYNTDNPSEQALALLFIGEMYESS